VIRERLDKLLSHMGTGTRKEVKQLIRQRRVTVDGAVATDPGLQVDPAVQAVAVDGEALGYRRHFHLMLHKPAGLVTATEDRLQGTVLDLIPPAQRHRDLHPVGRLDRDTEGLLLLTTDGELSHRLLAPRRHVPKRYLVRVEGRLGQDVVTAFATGIRLDDGYVTLPADLAIIASGTVSEAYVTIHEGKFHQIKRMFAGRGKRVLYLKRLAMGPLDLDEHLAPGEWRALSDAEVEALYRAADLPLP
jgi:16S rRNA pseudouridine516 synthase